MMPNRFQSHLHLLAVSAVLAITSVAPACRYNVRETGFVDLGIEPYRLCLLVDANTPAETAETFLTVAQKTLAETNIRPEIVHIPDQNDHPVVKYARILKIDTYPTAVLVSCDHALLPPEKAALVIPIAAPGKPLAETVAAALNRLAASPKREEIIRSVALNYAAVLLFEGPDPNENATARSAAQAACDAIAEQMDFLPKPIANPPALVVVDHNSLDAERILLWSMTLSSGPADVNRPHAAVLYGRARWIGPLFDGPDITAAHLTRILFVVGNDCECGLDYRWLQGTMLPVRWAARTRELVARTLGFDPENPMIQMEMARILGRGGASYPSTPFGYQELEIEMEPPDAGLSAADINDVDHATQDANTPAAVDAEPNQPDKRQLITAGRQERPAGEPNSPVQSMPRPTRLRFTMLTLLAFLIIAGVIFIAGVAIVLRASRR